VERAQVSRDPALQELLDKQAIAEVIQRYARTLDWLDDEGQASCYWPDAAIDYTFFKGSAAEFVPVVMSIERSSQRRWHMLSGLAIQLDSPTTARTECYGMATGIRETDGVFSGRLIGGRYLDEFQKRDGEWRISKRDYIMDWETPLGVQNDGTPDPAFPLPVLKIVESGHPAYRPM
jgi:hypothetical protein